MAGELNYFLSTEEGVETMHWQIRLEEVSLGYSTSSSMRGSRKLSVKISNKILLRISR